MDKVRLALVLLTVAITVGPILGIVLIYRDNLAGLIVPPEMNQVINDLNSGSQNGSLPGQSGTGILPEQTGPTDFQYDAASRTFSASFQFKNPFPLDVTLKSVSGTAVCDEHGFSLGTVALKSIVNMKAGETVTVPIQGKWTEDAVNHFQTQHQGEKSVKVSLVDATINAGGMTVQIPDRISIGEVPLT